LHDLWFSFFLIEGALLIHDDSEVVTWGLADDFFRWSIFTGKILTTFKGHTESIYCVVAVENGRELISGSDDNKIKRWESKSGTCLVCLFEGFFLMWKLRYFKVSIL